MDSSVLDSTYFAHAHPGWLFALIIQWFGSSFLVCCIYKYSVVVGLDGLTMFQEAVSLATVYVNFGGMPPQDILGIWSLLDSQ